MAFALVQLGNKKTVVHKTQLNNRLVDTAHCVLLGKKHNAIIDCCHDDYELLNHFATMHNNNAFQIKLVNWNKLEKNVETPKCSMQEKTWHKRIKPKNLFNTLLPKPQIKGLELNQNITQIINIPTTEMTFQSMDIVEKIVPLSYDACNSSQMMKNSVQHNAYVSPPPLVPIGKSISIGLVEDFPSNAVNISDVKPVKSRRINKANICKYCNKKNTNIRRHITSMHKDEIEVKEFMSLANGNSKKKQVLSQIRRDGNFSGFKEKEYVLSRTKNEFDPKKYISCTACKIVVKKTSLRRHFQNNCPKKSSCSSSAQSIMKSSKAISDQIHEVASSTMRNLVFSSFREGPVKEARRFDMLILLYGNEMCLKYRSQHHYAMIRNRMIRLAKMVLQIKSFNTDIQDLKDVLKPRHFKSIMKVVNDIGHYNSTTGNYEKPTLPTEISASLKYVIKLFISECIKEGNIKEKKEAKDLLHLLQTALPAHVNKTAAESLLQLKRHKTPLLPLMNDIQKLNIYLLRERAKHHEALGKNFNLHHWINLGKLTLISIMLFNRRRPGEMERSLISDLNTIQKIDQNTEIYGKLADEDRLYVDSYLRFVVRGKLARGVPVLLHKEVYESVKLLIKYREQAGVLPDNPFIFGTPQNRLNKVENVVYRHHIATNLIRKFSEECGAKNPSTLRATVLRKHVATLTMSMHLDTDDLHNFQNYMGHADKIHREYYRQPIIQKDIIKVSKVLLIAQGDCSAIATATSNVYEHSNNSLVTTSSVGIPTTCINHNNFMHCTNTNKVYSDTNVANITPGPRKSTPLLLDNNIDSDGYDSEYIPHVSDDEDSNDDENQSPIKKRRRLFEMKGGLANIKRRWSTSEQDAARGIFASKFESGIVPTLAEISKATANCRELKKRTLPQIQLWLRNNLRKKETTRKSWDSPSRRTITERFDHYITGISNTYPSTKTILKTIRCNPELGDKTPRRVRSQIQNQKRTFQKSYLLQQQQYKMNMTF